MIQKSNEQSNVPTGQKEEKKNKNIKSQKALRQHRTIALKSDPEFWEQVWIMFENGANALTICQAYDIPKMTLYRWASEDPELAAKIEKFRHMRADGSADSVAQKAEQLEKVFEQQIAEGKPNPALGNLIFNMRTWDAKKGNPDKYGDKKTVEITQDTRVMHVKQLRDLNKRKIKDVTPETRKLTSNES